MAAESFGPPGEAEERRPAPSAAPREMTQTDQDLKSGLSVVDGEPRVRDIKRSLPDFVVWRWRAEDRRVCARGEHDYTQDCPEHGCPWCAYDDDMYDCEKCYALIDEEYPDPDCKVGDDCLICERCWLPDPTDYGHGPIHRCECKVAICRECRLCKDHVQKPGGYRGRPNRGGYPVDIYGDPIDCDHSWRDPRTGLWT
jgi:hypothetical protein